MKYLASRIRRLRRAHRLTLDALAASAECSKSLLSKIETGRITPTIATLSRIAAALGTSAGALLQESTAERIVFTPAREAAASLVRSDKGYEVFPFALGFAGKLMQPFLFVAEEGKVKKHRVNHEGDEWMYVLEGRLRFHVGDQILEMGPGDSLYFDPNLPHGVEAIAGRARYLAVFTQPLQENEGT
jgi:transcriptional regulator with XRE-family HTH domain